MPVELAISEAGALRFLLVLSRMAGLLIFLPVPGLRALPETLRPLVALALTIPMMRASSGLSTPAPDSGVFLVWCLAELCFGLLWGLAVHFLIEAFVLGAQFLALQAGYGYASVIDPSTQADAGLLQILAQLVASLLFFATGMHRQVLYLLGESLHRIPPGAYLPQQATAEQLIGLGTAMIEIAARLSLPLIGLLLLIDLSLALLGRLQAQLQMLSMAFPAKLLLSLFVLGMMSTTYVRIYEILGEQVLRFLSGATQFAQVAVPGGV
jgi:flagellar biosynthetic protein FliR